jgi:hypothetical protein
MFFCLCEKSPVSLMHYDHFMRRDTVEYVIYQMLAFPAGAGDAEKECAVTEPGGQRGNRRLSPHL